jgi:hypothetical protein
MRAQGLLFIFIMPATCWAQSAFTDARDRRPTDDFAIRSCANAAEREVRSHTPGAGKVETDDAKASPASDTRTDVTGGGTYEEGAGTARHFTYRCSYDLKTNATSDISVNSGF